MFYYQLENENLGKIRDYIISNTDIKIIHIQRINILKQLASYRIAQKTQDWIANNKKRSHDRIKLNPNDCLLMFKKWYNYFHEYTEFLKNHDVLNITYEDISSDNMQKIIYDVQNFLCIKPIKLYPLTTKQRKRKISETIENYNELYNYFHGTEWEFLFHE